MIAFDYRGFGLSTGTPTEEGLIIDGMAAIMFVLNALAIPPNRITILAQSLGTAVSSAVVLHLTDGAAAEELLPSYQNSEDFTPPFAVASSMDFNAVILVAPFASIPTLMKTYRVFKLIPILSPLRFYPFIEEWVSGRIGETWNTEARVTALAQAYSNMEEDRKLHLHFIHAIDDFDIPYRHSEQLMYAAANGSRASGLSRSEFEDEKEKHVITRKGGRLTWPLEGPDGSSRGEVLLDIVRFGGHNRLGTLPPVALAVKRALGEGRITEQIAME